MADSFFINSVQYDGLPFPNPEMMGWPEDFTLVVEGVKYDTRPDALQLEVAAFYAGGSDLRLYSASGKFQADGKPIDSPIPYIGRGQFSGWAMAGWTSFQANPGPAGYYPQQEILLAPEGTEGNWWRSEVVSYDTDSGFLTLRDPLPEQTNWAKLMAERHIDDTVLGVKDVRFPLPVNSVLVINHRNYRVTDKFGANTYYIDPPLQTNEPEDAEIGTLNWPENYQIFTMQYNFNRSYDIKVIQPPTAIIGMLGLKYGVPLTFSFTLRHIYGQQESVFGMSRILTPPIVGAVQVVEQMPRLKDGSTRVIKLTLSHPLIDENKLKLTASPLLINKPKTQGLSGSVIFDAYGKTAEVPVRDPR